nr:hypothetical protein CFP56_40049 [Quercus suber]
MIVFHCLVILHHLLSKLLSLYSIDDIKNKIKSKRRLVFSLPLSTSSSSTPSSTSLLVIDLGFIVAKKKVAREARTEAVNCVAATVNGECRSANADVIIVDAGVIVETRNPAQKKHLHSKEIGLDWIGWDKIVKE